MNDNTDVKTNVKERLSTLAAIIVAGMCANPSYAVMKTEEILGDAIDMAESIMKKADRRIEESFENEEETWHEDGHKYGEYIGMCDRNGRSIRNGDIFIHLKYSDLKEIPADFLEKYADKYSNKVELHPVFWSDELKSWASDVYRDEDYMSSYDTSLIEVVSDVSKHPELYNH